MESEMSNENKPRYFWKGEEIEAPVFHRDKNGELKPILPKHERLCAIEQRKSRVCNCRLSRSEGRNQTP